MSFSDYLDEHAPALLARDNLPGAAIALIENASPVLVKTWGYADLTAKQEIDRNTLFNVASISKVFTAWGILKLVEQSQVELNRPIEDYLGGWYLPPSPYNHDLVTVRRLLSHTAGINTEGIKGIAPTGPHFSTSAVLEGRLPALDEYQRQYCLQWGVDPERDRDPVSVKFQPGEAFHYSNMGFTLLQLLIEKVSGCTFPEFMQSEILDPLGIPTAGFTTPDPSNTHLATAHGIDGTPLPFYRHIALAAAGLHCSIDDLARFACAELNGAKSIISDQGLATLFEHQCHAETLEGMDFDTALGHFRLELGNRTFLHHTGGVLGWRSVYGVVPQTGHGFCALINSDGGNQFWMELLKAWFESI